MTVSSKADSTRMQRGVGRGGQRGRRRLGLLALLAVSLAASGCGAGLHAPLAGVPGGGPLAAALTLGVRTAGGIRSATVSLLLELRDLERADQERPAYERPREGGLFGDPVRITLFTFGPDAPAGRSVLDLLPPKTTAAAPAARRQPAPSAPASAERRVALLTVAMDSEIIMR